MAFSDSDSQSFGNIPVTGEIDAATRRLIRRPRCGVGDSNQTRTFLSDNLHYRGGNDGDKGEGDGGGGVGHYYRHKRRAKRYVLQGPKWDKTDLTWR